MDYTEEVRIIKLKLSGLHDPAITPLLPGASRVAREVADLLDRMLITINCLESEPHGT